MTRGWEDWRATTRAAPPECPRSTAQRPTVRTQRKRSARCARRDLREGAGAARAWLQNCALVTRAENSTQLAASKKRNCDGEADARQAEGAGRPYSTPRGRFVGEIKTALCAVITVTTTGDVFGGTSAGQSICLTNLIGDNCQFVFSFFSCGRASTTMVLADEGQKGCRKQSFGLGYDTQHVHAARSRSTFTRSGSDDLQQRRGQFFCERFIRPT